MKRLLSLTMTLLLLLTLAACGGDSGSGGGSSNSSSSSSAGNGEVRAEDGFALGEGFPEAVAPEMDLVFLCQPNNPTGRTVPRPLLERTLARCREADALLVVDECFLELLDRPEDFAMKGFLGRYPNLLILKAFTKLYAMAGLREVADELETLTAKKYWPFPSYGEMLFSIQ